MNDDDLYGLNQTSPLRSIYDRGSRSIYAPRTDPSAMQTMQQLQNRQQVQQQQRTQATYHVAPAQVPDTNADNMRIFERHLQALQDIDRRLALLNQRDDLLQAKVQYQELQLERLQQSMKRLFEQNQASIRLQNLNSSESFLPQSAPLAPYNTLTPVTTMPRAATSVESAVLAASTVSEAAASKKSTGPTGPACNDLGGSGSSLLVAIGIAIMVLLFTIVALMLTKWRQQEKDAREARNAQAIEQHVKQAVYDVLSQSQPDASRLGSTSYQRPIAARSGNLTNSYSLPVAFGP